MAGLRKSQLTFFNIWDSIVTSNLLRSTITTNNFKDEMLQYDTPWNDWAGCTCSYPFTMMTWLVVDTMHITKAASFQKLWRIILKWTLHVKLVIIFVIKQHVHNSGCYIVSSSVELHMETHMERKQNYKHSATDVSNFWQQLLVKNNSVQI